MSSETRTRRRAATAAAALVGLSLLAACANGGSGRGAGTREAGTEASGRGQAEPPGDAAGPVTRLTLTSPAFADSQTIPAVHTCDGADASPPLAWQDPSTETASYALVVDDPHAPDGNWVHWLVYDIPAGTTSLPHGAGAREAPGGGVQGMTSWKKNRYGGPCPPPGKPHQYYFQLFALRERLALGAEATKEEVLKAIQDKSADKAVLMGIYER